MLCPVGVFGFIGEYEKMYATYYKNDINVCIYRFVVSETLLDQ